MMKSEILEYSSVLKKNREVFLLNFPQELQAFEESYDFLNKITMIVSKKRDDNNNVHIHLIPFIIFILRQAINAFESFSRHQSYDAWSIFRPAIESTINIGKFIDDPYLYNIWKDKNVIFSDKRFKKEKAIYYKYFNDSKAILPNSLLYAEKFRKLLTKINDDFMHVNPNYLSKNFTIEVESDETQLWSVSYVDVDFQEHRAYIYSFINLFRKIVSDLWNAIAIIYKNEKIEMINPNRIEDAWIYKVNELLIERPDLKETFVVFGLFNID